MAHLLLFKALSWLFASSDTDAVTGKPQPAKASPLKIGATAGAAALGYFLFKKYHKPAPKKLKEPIRVVITGAAGQIVRLYIVMSDFPFDGCCNSLIGHSLFQSTHIRIALIRLTT